MAVEPSLIWSSSTVKIEYQNRDPVEKSEDFM